MKTTFLLIAFSLLVVVGFGQGIKFEEGNFSQLLSSAHQQNKLLMIEIYLTGCPHCAALEPVLKEREVGDFFNAAFVNAKIEANSEVSKVLQTQKGITYIEFPVFFFFDYTGQLLHQATPAERAIRTEAIAEVLKHGKDAITPSLRTSNYAARFDKGERDLLFLVNYGKYTKAIKDTNRQTQIATELAKVFTKPSDLESPTGLYILKNLINDFQNPIAKYFFDNFSRYKDHYSNSELNDAGEGILYYTLYGTRADKLSSVEVVAIRNAMIQMGTSPKIAATRTILKELEAYFREKNTTAATNRLNDYIKSTTLLFEDYAYLVRLFNEKATDNSYVPSLIIWANNGIKSSESNNKALADLYAELSKAYLRISNKIEGRNAAQKALDIAKEAKIDTKPYADALVKIK